MAYEIPGLLASFTAGEDLSSAQYLAVKINSDGNIVKAGAGERAIGILQDKPENGKAGSVMLYGISKAVYGASVTAGDVLEVDSDGKLIPYSSGIIVAIALENGSADEIHSVKLI